MEKQELKQVIIDQKEEWNKLIADKKIIKREFLKYYEKSIDSSLIKVIMGIRRCGKSIFCYQLLEGKRFAYVNFDDERLNSLGTSDLNNVLEALFEVYGKVEFIFLDEIQNITGWELFANRLQRQGLNLVITGSNANLLSRELATHLTGRHIPITLFPFSFKEYLAYFDIKTDTTSTLSTIEIGLIKKRLDEYIKSGGFPQLLDTRETPDSYLRALYSTIIDKDVVMRHKIRFFKTLRDIAGYLTNNYSAQMSFNKVQNIFSLKSTHTALNYVSFIEESCLIFVLKRHSFKHKEYLTAPRKVYCIDTGMINALAIRSSNDFGRIYENVVAIELTRRSTLNNTAVYYWQDTYKNEVDFIVKKGLKINNLIQVCYDLSNYDTKKREINSLIKCSNDLKCNNLLIITYDKEGDEMIDKKKLKYIPLWKWLLEKED